MVDGRQMSNNEQTMGTTRPDADFRVPSLVDGHEHQWQDTGFADVEDCAVDGCRALHSTTTDEVFQPPRRITGEAPGWEGTRALHDRLYVAADSTDQPAPSGRSGE